MASLSALTSIVDQFRVSIGSWLVGAYISTLGVGMLLQQTMRYFRLYPADPHFLKIWVVLAVVFQLLTTAMVMHASYYYLVTYYMNPSVFAKKDIVWSAGLVPVFGPISNLISERCDTAPLSTHVEINISYSFFARRVYMMGHQYRWIALSGLTMVLISSGFYIGWSSHTFGNCGLKVSLFCQPVKTVQAFTLDIAADALVAAGWITTLAAALLLAGDVQLTATLVYVLRKGRSGIKRTDSMVDMLIMYAISTGSLICVLNVVSLVLLAWLVRLCTTTFVVAYNGGPQFEHSSARAGAWRA
ncbi:hypothetical protein NUW54_g11238 [Trametes sanguinea]|uniref:Uncharacterized protein n=1 Tax=Trametes sanguinea TaxID=158606 RepID=A0ACC1NHM4_9APHY|nr:hypothetical protein NUW54_g11238 [Trametes sanguinea]